MSFESRPLTDLIRIAAAGGGFTFDTTDRAVFDLIRIAAAAGNSGAKITFKSIGGRPTHDLLRISAAGKGNIILEE